MVYTEDQAQQAKLKYVLKKKEAKQPCIIEWLKQNYTALRPDWEGVTQFFKTDLT